MHARACVTRQEGGEKELFFKNQDCETTVELNSKRRVKRSHVTFSGSEGVLKAQTEPFSVLMSRAFSASFPRARSCRVSGAG